MGHSGIPISAASQSVSLPSRKTLSRSLNISAGISNASIAKLGRNENVNTDILLKICVALGCDVADILEIVSDESE